jgi:hypothetical protein
MDLESKHTEKKAAFDRVTVGLSVEQSNIEKECDLAQVSDQHDSECTCARGPAAPPEEYYVAIRGLEAPPLWRALTGLCNQ